jgi:AcrR family transcriptional regulator
MYIEPSQRKKQPESMRRILLDCAQQMALERGLAGLTIQAVADAAGVTKGGLFHHFSSRQALLKGMYEDIAGKLDLEIDRIIATDREAWGCFTRAYISVLLSPKSLKRKSPMALFSIAMIEEPQLDPSWLGWLTQRLQRHAHTDSDPVLEIARFAADGAWLGYTGCANRSGFGLLQERLKAMTLKPNNEAFSSILAAPASSPQ